MDGLTEPSTPPSLAGALIVMLVGSAIFAFGSFGVRAKLPGSRALQVVGVATVTFAVFVLIASA
jgi:hypothetical protein